MFAYGLATPISLDATTLIIVATCVTALLGVFLLYAWNQDRVGALAWWGAAYLIGGFSIALWVFDPHAVPFMPASLSSSLLFLACGMIWSAARLFHNHKVLWGSMCAGAVVWISACMAPTFIQSSGNRFILASLIIATYTFLTAAELWDERRKSLIRRWPALFVPALHGAVFLFPLPIASMMPHETGVITITTGWLAVFILEMLLYAVGTAFIVLVLTKERTLRMHKTAALTDPLTGLFNRRGLMEAARDLAEKHARKAGKPIAVLAFDLDHFKTVNDRFGHAVGDDLLKLFAATANNSLRLTDFVVRLGGEEFAAIMPGTLEEGVVVAERVRAAFEAAARTVSGCFVGATVSVGVASHANASDIDALLARADAALYAAKANGRNRVETERPQAEVAQAEAPQAEAPQADAEVAVSAPIVEPQAEPAVATAGGTVDWSGYRRPNWAPTERQVAA